MASVNKVILIGNLGRDPETRMTADGRPICSLALATTRRYKDSQGALQEETEWHRVTLFGRQAEVAPQAASPSRAATALPRATTALSRRTARRLRVPPHRPAAPMKSLKTMYRSKASGISS